MENNDDESSRTATSWSSGSSESALMLRSRARGVWKHEGKPVAVLILRDGAARLLRMTTRDAAVGWAGRGARFVRVGKIACASCPRGNAMASDFAHPVDAARRERRWFQVPCASPIFDLSRFLAHAISSNILSFSAAREARGCLNLSLCRPPRGVAKRREAHTGLPSRLRGATTALAKRGVPLRAGRRPSALHRGDFRPRDHASSPASATTGSASRRARGRTVRPGPGSRTSRAAVRAAANGTPLPTPPSGPSLENAPHERGCAQSHDECNMKSREIYDMSLHSFRA